MRISIERAAELLKSGNVVGVPTETVYGLAASLSSPEAIRQIFILKGRPSNNPLIVHSADVENMSEYIDTVPEGFMALARAFWPGPMTLVLDARIEKIPGSVRGGLPTVAFRIPSHEIARELLRLTGPLVMPSANLSGTPSATRAEHVEADFGKHFPVIEGEGSRVGVESTILIFIDGQWQIIRRGALPPSAFADVLGYAPPFRGISDDTTPLCPGQLYRHYAPKARLVLSERCMLAEKNVIVGYSDRSYPESNRILSLGRSTNPEEIAENLYSTLRLIDDLKIPSALVDIELPCDGLYGTILERLHKAALCE